MRCHASRVPQVGSYIADFLQVALPCIVNGIGDCITLVILEEETVDSGGVGGGGGGASTSSGERTGRTKTVERFVFHFDIDGVIGNSSGCSNILGSRGSTDGDKRMQSSKIIDIEDMKPQKSAIEIDADLATEARSQMERSMRDVLLRTVALRKRRRRPGEKAENMSFKLCLHVVGEQDEKNGKKIRDANSCPDELMRVLKQGEWLVPEQSSCYFPSSAFASAANESSSGGENGQKHSKGMLRPIKDISLPSCGMKMQLGMEVDPSA